MGVIRGYGRRPRGAGWQFLGKLSKQNTGTQAIGIASVTPAVKTTGIIVPVKANEAIHIIRYWANYLDAAESAHLFFVSALLIDVFVPAPPLVSQLCLSEYSDGDWPSHFIGYAGQPPGQQLNVTQRSIQLVDDWIKQDDFVGMLPANNPLSTFTIQSQVQVGNDDGAAAHTVAWNETLVWEVWERTLLA